MDYYALGILIKDTGEEVPGWQAGTHKREEN
jgi:hypothetical protein